MAWRDNIHSHLVAGMKIALPLAALGVLSTLFLLSKSFDPAESLSITRIDLQQKAQDQGVTNATFAGLTQTGDAILVQAAKSKPSEHNPRLFLAEDVSAEYSLASGGSVDITSLQAEMNQKTNSASLLGDVQLTTTTGYTINTDQLDTRFDDLYAESPGPVTAKGPPGCLSAGRMVLKHRQDTGSSHLLFTDGVKLVYQRKSQED